MQNTSKKVGLHGILKTIARAAFPRQQKVEYLELELEQVQSQRSEEAEASDHKRLKNIYNLQVQLMKVNDKNGILFPFVESQEATSLVASPARSCSSGSAKIEPLS